VSAMMDLLVRDLASGAWADRLRAGRRPILAHYAAQA